MPSSFKYWAKNQKAEDINGTIEASSQTEAIAALQKKGLIIISLKEAIAAGARLWPGAHQLHAFGADIENKIRTWCKDKNGFIRLPILVFFAYLFIRHLSDPMYSSLLHGVDLYVHEHGHILLMFFAPSSFIHIAAGTIAQLAAPIAFFIYFLRKKDYFGCIFFLGWLSISLFDVATYAGDAQTQALPLLFGGGKEGHDWYQMLSRMGILQFDWLVAGFFRFCAVFCMLTCLMVGGWMVALMLKNKTTALR